MAASSNDRTGWRIPKEQEDDDRLIVAQKKKKSNKAKVTVPHVPLQRYNSAIMVVATTARSSPIAVEAKGRNTSTSERGVGLKVSNNKLFGAGVEGLNTTESGDSERTGASRRKEKGMKLANTTKKISHKLVRETTKKIIAREKAEEEERKVSSGGHPKGAQDGDEEDSNEEVLCKEEGWLMPETRLTRRKAKAMRGVRSKSVDRLEIDDLEHFSEQRLYVRARRILPRPFGRKLIEDRQELVGVLNMPRNKRMRKAGITESHLAILADVYKEVVANAILRNQEDAAGLQGPLTGTRPVSEVEKGVGVSSFATALGIPPFLFMREMLWASNHLYAHAVPGEMNRATWMFGCISLCLMTERELVEFAFRTCKVTDKGDLERGELERLAKSLHLSNNAFWSTFSNQLAEVSRGQELAELVLDMDYILGMHHKFPMILYPALRMQELLQRRTLGLRVWGRLSNRLDRYLVRQKGIADGSIKPNCLCVLLDLQS